jgi:LysR family transcriptional regulator, carnitine catabolism transcriptional activator
MERRQLEYFLAVIDHGGFTAAGLALRVSQPALSAAIKALEKDVGAMLFHRLPRGVKLTAAGAELAGSARVIMRELDTARARVDAVTGLIAGRLDMISLPGLLLDPLAPVIGEYRRQHPGVRVRVVQAEAPEDVRDAVRAGEAELGLTDEIEQADRDVAGELIAEQELVAVLPPGSPAPPDGALPMAALLTMDLVAGPPGTAIRDSLSRAAAGLGARVSPAVEVTPRGSALYLAMAGAGVAILPRPVAELGLPHGIVIASLRPRQVRQVYLLRRAAPLSPAAREIRVLLLPRQLGAAEEGVALLVVEGLQSLQGRDRRRQGRRLIGGQLADQRRERGGARLAALPHVLAAGLGDGDQGDALVPRVAGPLDEALPLQAGDERGHGRLGHALDRGQLGDPLGPGPVQRGQGRQRGEADVPGHAAQQRGEQAVDRGGGREAALVGLRGLRRVHVLEHIGPSAGERARHNTLVTTAVMLIARTASSNPGDVNR